MTVTRQIRPSRLPSSRTMILTAFAMLAFAGNSVLCRLALAKGQIDPASFTLVRIGSGTAALLLIAALAPGNRSSRGSWRSAFALVAYAAAFSYAYVLLSAGTGAFLLFAAVQATMVIAGLARGDRLSGWQWLGLALALSGLAALVSPGASAPPFANAALMTAAGIAWGAYSLLGRGETDALGATAGNFLRALPIAAVLMVLTIASGVRLGPSGLLYGTLSGVVASGLGYSIWYAALPGLSPAQGASVQLSVPVIAALIGVVALAEPITWRLGLSSLAILGGIAFVIASRERAP